MAHVKFISSYIDIPKQVITIDGRSNTDAWCTSISTSAGIGATTAEFSFPFLYADSIGDRYADKKVIVKAGIGRASRIVFIGFLSGKQEDISESEDSFTMTAYTAGHYLSKVGVGEDLNHWEYKYPLFYDTTGAPTGLTPALVLTDIFARLSNEWKNEIGLGDISAIVDAYDLPVQNYEFSLSTYDDAINALVNSLGDVAVRERFADDKVLLDFFRISDPSAPVNTAEVAEWDTGSTANVGTYSPAVTTDELINKSIAFGTDKEFMITCKSIVDELPAQSETDTEKALIKDWDPDLEAMVLKDPRLATSDRVNRSLVIKTADPGTTGTTFDCETGINLIPNKCILVHPESGERMLVTGFTPYIPASVPPAFPTPEVLATVTVQRLYQAEEGDAAGNLKKDKPLSLEVPGAANVFRRYRLPVALYYRRNREFLPDLPLIDADTNERYDSQVFYYKSNVNPSNEEQQSKTGTISTRPTLLTGENKDFDKHRIHLPRPAVVPVSITKTTDKNGKNVIIATYKETVVGCTFAYIDHTYPFGWTTGTVDSKLDLPWETHTERNKLDEFVFWQATNQNWPVIGVTGNELEFDCTFINPKTENFTTGYAILRNDLAYLKTAADRVLMEKNRPHVSAGVIIPWVDFGYQIGNRLTVKGLENQPEELLTITQVAWSMSEEGDQSTAITVDNIKPPARKSFNTKIGQAV